VKNRRKFKRSKIKTSMLYHLEPFCLPVIERLPFSA